MKKNNSTITPEIEFKSSSDIEQYQSDKFLELITYLNQKSHYYKNLFLKNNIDIANISSIEDITNFPFTTKNDLAEKNDEFLCVPKNKIADYVTTSGTVGDPVTYYMTSKDLDRLAYNEAISLQCADGSENDIYQLTTTIDKRFMAGLAYYLGVQRLNAGMVRVGPGAALLQWDSIKRFSPTVLIAIPSFIPKLIQYATDNNIDFKNSSVKSIVCIGEPIRNPNFSLNELGKRISSLWNVKLYSTYASTEMGAAFTECENGVGGHHHPEILIVEVTDNKGNNVKEGDLGEVVVTTLGVEGMPLLRYKTGDLCHVYYESCKCGRNTTRLGPVIGRKQQMIKFKGTTIYPPSIFEILEMLPAINLYQIEISKTEFDHDHITIFLPNIIESDLFKNEISTLFKSRLRVTPDFKFISPDILQKRVLNENQRKPIKIIYTSNRY